MSCVSRRMRVAFSQGTSFWLDLAGTHSDKYRQWGHFHTLSVFSFLSNYRIQNIWSTVFYLVLSAEHNISRRNILWGWILPLGEPSKIRFPKNMSTPQNNCLGILQQQKYLTNRQKENKAFWIRAVISVLLSQFRKCTYFQKSMNLLLLSEKIQPCHFSWEK